MSRPEWDKAWRPIEIQLDRELVPPWFYVPNGQSLVLTLNDDGLVRWRLVDVEESEQ